jgi:hypothetical protein
VADDHGIPDHQFQPMKITLPGARDARQTKPYRRDRNQRRDASLWHYATTFRAASQHDPKLQCK